MTGAQAGAQDSLRYRACLRLHTSDFLPPGSDTSTLLHPQGPGASLQWLTHAISGNYLILVGYIQGRQRGTAIAVVDEAWQLLATHFRPDDVPMPDDGMLVRTGCPYAAHLALLEEDSGGVRATLALEYTAQRHYPGDAGSASDGGMILTSFVADWFALQIDFAAQPRPDIRVGAQALHRESLCGSLSQASVAGRRYWLAVHERLPDGWDPQNPADAKVLRWLAVADDERGVPGAWRPVAGGEEAVPLRSGYRLFGTADAQAYDNRHLAMLLQAEGRSFLCLLDPAAAKITHTAPLRIARGHWTMKAWHAMPGAAGGYVWLHTSNDKLSTKHRDATLWRLAYGAAAQAKGKRTAALATRLERLTEDRVVTGAAILDYTDFTLALWNQGLGVKHIDPLRCVAYPLAVDEPQEAAQAVPALTGSLPHWPAQTVEHFGRPTEQPARPRIPEQGFSFAGKRVAVYPLHGDLPGFAEGFELGEMAGEP
jgi:hypothetical protein